MATSGGGTSDFAEKVAYFQAITGLDDLDLCTEILDANGWDLEVAISSITSSSSSSASAAPAAANHTYPSPSLAADRSLSSNQELSPPPGIAWRLVTLPFYVISGGLGLVSGAVGIGVWIAGGILSRSLGLLGLLPSRGDSSGSAAPLVPPISPTTAEAVDFVEDFEREYGSGGGAGVNFVVEGFMDALQRSRQEFKLMFVYLHSPDHPDTSAFCSGSLCSELLAEFVNENFVSWGGSIRRTEGFKMSNSLKASRFPFCAVVMASTNHMIALIQQIEGPKSPEEMLMILQKVLEENGSTFAAARIEAEERRKTLRLRGEQDAAYRASLEADRAREQQRKDEQDKLEREAAEAVRKRKEEEEAQEKAAQKTAEKEAAIVQRRQEKVMALGPEPQKGPDATQVLVRFPSGDRKERRFHSSATVKFLYDYVDTLECLKAESYTLISNFPRVTYGPEKHLLTLKEAGLHPQASLFVEVAEL